MITLKTYGIKLRLFLLKLIVWCIKLKLRMFMKFLVKIKKCFDLINYSVKSDKYETDVVAIEMLVGLKPKMYSF